MLVLPTFEKKNLILYNFKDDVESAGCISYTATTGHVTTGVETMVLVLSTQGQGCAAW